MTLLMASKMRSRLLAFLFSHPGESYYVRELASLVEADPGNLSRELRRLEEEGVCRSSMKGRIKFYSLDKGYPLHSDLKNILFKMEGVEGVLKKLVQAYAGIELALLYGSFARGAERKSSDIDLLLVGTFDRDRFVGELRGLESRLDREVNFTSFSRAEFDRERKKAGSFLNIVLKNKVVMLKGIIDGR